MGYVWDKSRGLVVPDKFESNKLAELTGAMFGDGCVHHSKNSEYRIELTGNLLKDYDYMLYLKEILEKTFKIKFTVIKNEKNNSITIRLRSKTLFLFFKDKIGCSTSPKKNMKIPNWINENEGYLISFFRGLFDTDGCVVFQKDKKYIYPIIKISCQKDFTDNIKINLEKIGINCFACNKGDKTFCNNFDVIIKRKKDVLEWINKISSKNERNLKNLKIIKDNIYKTE